MISRHQRNAAILLPVAAQFRDAERLAEQPVHRRRAERHDGLGLDEINLLLQIRNARCALFRRGRTIAGGLAGRVRPAFQNVGDVDVAARKAGGQKNFREQLPGATDERLALFVFIRTRRFADEHQLRVNVADAKNNRRARRRKVRTFHARQRAFAQRGKCSGFCRRRTGDFNLGN